MKALTSKIQTQILGMILVCLACTGTNQARAQGLTEALQAAAANAQIDQHRSRVESRKFLEKYEDSYDDVAQIEVQDAILAVKITRKPSSTGN